MSTAGDGDGLRWQQIRVCDHPAGFLSVQCRTYRYPDGEEGDWDILTGGHTVAVLALTDDDHVVLVRQFRPGPEAVLLELPGGMVDAGESVMRAAARELREETGFEAAALELVTTTFLAGYATHMRHAVLARGCRRVGDPQPGPDEFVQPLTMPMVEFIPHVLSGQLTDMDIAMAGLVAAGVLVVQLPPDR